VAAGTAAAGGMSAAAASPTFAIPPPAVPASCRGLLERHEWCLLCEATSSDQLAVQLRVSWRPLHAVMARVLPGMAAA